MLLPQVSLVDACLPLCAADGRTIGELKPEPMITRKIQMDEIEEKGFKALIEEKDKHVKVLVEVNP